MIDRIFIADMLSCLIRNHIVDKNSIDIDTLLSKMDSEISNLTSDDRTIITEKFILAALGCIPWIGGFISAAASFKFEDSDRKIDGLKLQWLREHAVKIEQLSNMLSDVIKRFENFGSEVDERIQNDEYLSIVRKAFTVWDHADTEEKRKYIGNLVSNAAGTNLCSDDIIRLFIDWLDHYHEFHFLVIREIYQGMNISRYDIWSNLRGEIPREDSADADLFKLLIRDLSTRGVIRQSRNTNFYGEFVKATPTKNRNNSNTMESAFERTKQYELTELGKQFVHYTMNDVVQRIT